ncbi:O-antigen ligase family protein [Oscillatoria salina]|uniref:O-antigen ligase family protein n=1 Tax=Oscillatoria salina TaxID=331517 RepID=UPI001CCE796C|nr:O-antigen ligase domain-containing protein [Oscillatoria salina]
MKPQNFEEKVVWYLLLGTYIVYYLGAQPLVMPAVAWLLFLYLVKKLWCQTPDTPPESRITIPFSVWIWVICLLVMFFGVIIAHVQLDLGAGRLIRSLIKWNREWALWALFPLIACLKIRPQLLYRGVCILCLQSFPLIILSYVAFFAGLPGELYTSPISALGGDSDFYRVVLYIFDADNNQMRTTLYSPWAPNMAMVGMMFFFMVRQETNKKLRFLATSISVLIILTPISRLATVSFPFILFASWGLVNLGKPILHFASATLCFLGGIFGVPLKNFMEVFIERFHSVRENSSDLRITLVRMSLERWWKYAPIWGHGYIEKEGPAYTYGFPIGTSGCGSWVNLLYTKGIVGCTAVAIPMLYTFIELLRKAQKNVTARVGLSVYLVFLCFSFIEELDILAHIYWPGILMLGLALTAKEKPVSQPVNNQHNGLLALPAKSS